MTNPSRPWTRRSEPLRFEIKRIQRESGITAIYVTHDQEEALSISDRVALMNDGRIEQTGSPREIYLRPANSFAADCRRQQPPGVRISRRRALQVEGKILSAEKALRRVPAAL